MLSQEARKKGGKGGREEDKKKGGGGQGGMKEGKETEKGKKWYDNLGRCLDNFYRLNCGPPPNVCVETLTSNTIVFGNGASGG